MPSATTGATSTEAQPDPSTAASPDPGTDLIMDVDLGGRTIHLTCFGPTDEKAPTVLLEAGGDESSDVWDVTMDELSLTRRTCSYDRPGTGASPLPPKPRRTAEDLVRDLEMILRKADVDGPFVLVGHSMAIWPLSVYAEKNPEDVAGVVLVDPRGPHVSARWLAALPPPRAHEPTSIRENREDLTVFEHDPSLNREHLDVARAAAQAGEALDAPGPLFGNVPMVVLGATDTHLSWSDLPPGVATRFDRIWLDEQKALAAESTDGAFQTVPESGHAIQVDQPEVVIDAIESVLARATR